MTLSELNGAILKAVGYKIDQTLTKTIGGAWKYTAEFAGEGKVPFVAKASGKGPIERETSNTAETSAFDPRRISKLTSLDGKPHMQRDGHRKLTGHARQ